MSSGPAGMHGAKQNPKNKRKRKRGSGQDAPSGVSCNDRPVKQPRKGLDGNLQPPDVVKHALLAQYYPTILTLRQYVLYSLPASSKIRRKKVSAVGIPDQAAAEGAPAGVQQSKKDHDYTRASLARLLDTTLVGTHGQPSAFGEDKSDGRLQRWIDYSRRGDDSHVTLSGDVASAVYCQTEVGSLNSWHWMSVKGHRSLLPRSCTPEADGYSQIVDFIIWLLFSREIMPGARPHHLLCDGFRKHVGPRQQQCSVQGLYSAYPNERVAVLRQTPWPQLLSLLGNSGEGMMINMLLDCAIFLPIKTGQSSYYQLSGQRLFPGPLKELSDDPRRIPHLRGRTHSVPGHRASVRGGWRDSSS